MHGSSLFTIIAHARSGALDHAWRLFREAGLETVDDDPAVLAVHGRLLKDQALATRGDERQDFYRRAADTYGRAAAIDGAVYPLINAATLALLAGEPAKSERRARQALERLASAGPDADTPYYLAATRAEALLLTGEVAQARQVLGEAVALAPQAWEDHASTLRQFALILDAKAQSSLWLDALRPPTSLHFAGHMGVAETTTKLAQRVRDVIARERVGFGFGALAAGSDIVIAEALVEMGAELHLILPAPAASFRAASVEPFGEGWCRRFDAVLVQATTLRELGRPLDPPHPLGIRLAAEVAMGEALMHARALATQAMQLLVLDTTDPDKVLEVGGSAWAGEAWCAVGDLQQITLDEPRVTHSVATPDKTSPVLAAVLLVAFSGGDTLAGATHLAQIVLPRLTDALAKSPVPLAPPTWRGESVQVAFASPADAADAAVRMAGALKDLVAFRIAGAYDRAIQAMDPGGPILGPAVNLPMEILPLTPPGAILVSDLFAAAMQMGPRSSANPPRVEYVGDLPSSEIEAPSRLFALKASPDAG